MTIKEYQKQYREANKEKAKAYRIINKIKLQEQAKIYQSKIINKSEKYKEYCLSNKERLKEAKRLYRISNKEKISKYNKYYIGTYEKKRKESDPIFKLKCNLRTMISNSLKKKGYIKVSKSNAILGCSFIKFKEHLESNFQSWMSWDNYGKYNGELNYGWDIDHIIPLSSAITENDVIKLNHYTNLQPLCSYTNRVIKKDNIVK
jgi:hypothetical protein